VVNPPPDETPVETKPRWGLRLPWDIVVAPARALDEIAESPEWLPTYAVVVILAMLARVLELPAILHVYAVAKYPPGAQIPKPHEIIAGELIVAAFVPLVGILMTAVSFTLFTGLKDVSKMFAGSFGRYVALVTACSVIGMLGALVQAVGVRLHDPTHFTDRRSIETIVPITLGFFAAPGNDRQLEFLSNFGIFDVWSDIVMAFGLARFAGIGLTVGLVFVFALDLTLAIFTLSP
jgi:hypothetical protein